MDECPWCDEPLDLEEIYREHDLNDSGYFECPHCGKQLTINQEIYYTYSAEMGPLDPMTPTAHGRQAP